MYCTITMIDGTPELAEHTGLAEAEAFATDVASEGYGCRVMAVVRDFAPVDDPARPMGTIYGTGPTMWKEAHGW